MAQDRFDALGESERKLRQGLEEILTLTGVRQKDADAQFEFIREPLIALVAKALERKLKKLEPALTAMGMPEVVAKERIVGIFEDALDRVKRQYPQRFEVQEL